MKQININGIAIELEKKRIKNMYLRILPPEGRVHISAPIRMNEEEIRRFVLTKQDWILEQQGKVISRNTHHFIDYVTGDKLQVWGNEYSLVLTENYSRNKVILHGEQIQLYMKGSSTTQQREAVLHAWYKTALQEELPYLINKWELIMGVKSSGFTIRDMKTRWGTCNVRTKKICFNLQLIKKTPICLEYVVVHELVHLLERSHNYIFKGYMDKFLPEWRYIKKELNGPVS